MDNFATFNSAGAPIRKWSPASKQFDIEEKFIVECAERGIIAIHIKPGNLPEDPRPGEGFVADAMTKPMTASEMAFYYPELHGVNSLMSRIATHVFHTSRGGEQELSHPCSQEEYIVWECVKRILTRYNAGRKSGSSLHYQHYN